MKKPTAKETILFQAKKFPRNGTTGQIKQFSHGKSLAGNLQPGGTVSYEDRKSTWNSWVRKAIRRASPEQEPRKHRDRGTGDGKQMSKQRRRVNVSYDARMVTALQHGTWMDEEGFKETCIREKKKRGDIYQPLID